MNNKRILHLYNNSFEAKEAFHEFLSKFDKDAAVRLQFRDLIVETADEIHWFSFHMNDSDVMKHYGYQFTSINFNVELTLDIKARYLNRIRPL